MVDMFFYRDPEEVEKQQAEEAAAKQSAAQGEVEPAVGMGEWDVSGAPQAGGINPGLAQEGGTCTSVKFFPFIYSLSIRSRCS
jgi:small subunit ribosomal protein SAe